MWFPNDRKRAGAGSEGVCAFFAVTSTGSPGTLEWGDAKMFLNSGMFLLEQLVRWLVEQASTQAEMRAMDHTNHVRLKSAELTPEILEGAAIYGPDDEKIGSVDHLHGGQVVIDVGGFLGIGAKPVAVPANQMDFMRDEDGDVHAVTTWTKDQLKEMPTHRD